MRDLNPVVGQGRGRSDYEKVYQDWVRMMQVSETGL